MLSVNFSDKNLLKFVLSFEIFITVLIAAGILPREFAFSVTLMALVYIAGAGVIDSLVFTILSLPFYLAIPITASFDSMANWRIMILILFLKYAWERMPDIRYRISKLKTLKSENIRQFLFNKDIRLEILGLLFAIISFFSLIGANNTGAGIKKILFLANIFLIFIIVKNVVCNKEIFLRILKTSVLAGVFSLITGYAQLVSILFVSLAAFWQFWTDNVIAALYGKNLSELLSYSNTWFSYYQGDIPPTLRMFSVFPDSHSFALFNIILTPSVLALVFYYKKHSKKLFRSYCLLLILLLSAIIFSGSRGAWVSAMIPLAVIIFIRSFKINTDYPLKQFLTQKVKINFGFPGKSFRSLADGLAGYLSGDKLGMIISAMLLFFILFPVSSVFLEQTQKAEWQRLDMQGDFSSFAMRKRLKSIIDLDEISNKGRIEIWRNTFASIKDHPLLGVGIGNFTTVIGKNISAAKKGASAHNLFLDIFAETGLLGLIVFLAIFYEILKTAFLTFKSSTGELYKFFALSAGVYIVWVLGYSLFDVVLLNDKVLILFMVLAGSLYAVSSRYFDLSAGRR